MLAPALFKAPALASTKPPKYRFRDGLHPAIAEDFKLNPDAFINCRELPNGEQAKLCRERANLLRQRLTAYKIRGVMAVFTGTILQFEQDIAKEEAWATQLEAKVKPLFSTPDILTDYPNDSAKPEKLPFEGLIREKLESIIKMGISRKGVYYIVYKTAKVTSCQFVSTAKLLKAFADIQKSRKNWDLAMKNVISCCSDPKTVELARFTFTTWESEKLEGTKVEMATLAPLLVEWSNQVNGCKLDAQSEVSTPKKVPRIFQSKTSKMKEERRLTTERMVQTRSNQWAMLAEIRKIPGLPEKVMEAQIAAKKTGLKLPGDRMSVQPFSAEVLTETGEYLGKILLSAITGQAWIIKMESGEEIPVTSALEGLVVLKEPQQLALDF